MIISMYLAALMLMALGTLESVMPEWLCWVCILGPCVCYIIAVAAICCVFMILGKVTTKLGVGAVHLLERWAEK